MESKTVDELAAKLEKQLSILGEPSVAKSSRSSRPGNNNMRHANGSKSRGGSKKGVKTSIKSRSIMVLNPDEFQPPVDSDGAWVTPDGFKGTKSFGVFECPHCANLWISAHSFRTYRQGCKKCDYKTFPSLLWQNSKGDMEIMKAESESKGPHDVERCEACREGVCKRD